MEKYSNITHMQSEVISVLKFKKGLGFFKTYATKIHFYLYSQYHVFLTSAVIKGPKFHC